MDRGRVWGGVLGAQGTPVPSTGSSSIIISGEHLEEV